MKDKYEISLWEDYLVTPSVPDTDPEYVPPHYEERKICVIGSDTMTASYRAYNPELKSEINGTHTFTFKMYYTIKEDEITVNDTTFRVDEWDNFFVNGHTSDEQRTPTYSTFNFEGTKNPFLDLLVNERKVKCYWKGEWYDFIIKGCREESNGKSITYTCTDVFINELSKNGFNITLDADLENNTGTVLELANTVLEGTDWILDTSGSDVVQQKKEEPVYEVTTVSNWPLVDQNTQQAVTISSDKKVLIYYQQVQDIINYLEGAQSSSTVAEIQLAYAENYETDTNSQLVINAHTYTNVSNSPVYWYKDQTGQGTNRLTIKPDENSSTIYCRIYYDSGVSSNYRASRLVKQPISKLDSLTGKYCNVLIAQENPQTGSQWEGMYEIGDEIYKYKTTEWNDALVVNSLIVNGKDFISPEGWLSTSSLTFQLYPDYASAQSLPAYTSKSYLRLSNNTDVYNAGIRQSSNFIPNGFSIGEKYIFRYKAFTDSTGPSGNYASSGITPTVCTYKNENDTKVIDTNGPVYFSVEALPVPQQGWDGWVEFRLTCTKSITRAEIYQNKIALFLRLGGATRWLEEAQFFKEVYGEKVITEGGQQVKVPSRINPGDIDIESVSTIKYVYYNHTRSQGLLDPSDVINLWDSTIDWDYGSKLLLQYNDNFEKIRSITAKQSNRFNLIQSIAQTFECWAQFIINHDSTGRIIYDNGIPQKYVRFKNDIGQETGIGFIYGIDLKTIARTIQSDKIVTKTIVTQNSNEFAKNGFCTISRSTENYPRANFILNFDYYINRGLINAGILNNDLYDSTGDIKYYYLLHQYNTEYDDITELLDAKHIELTKQLSYQTVYEGTITSLQENIGNIKSDLMNLASVTTWDNNTLRWIKAHADDDRVKSKMIALETQQNNLSTYLGLKAKLDVSVSQLQSDIAFREERQKELVNLIKELDLKFYKKYSRFIQEGSWISEDYIDDTLYYLDAQSVAYTSSRPQISYEISVLRISSIEEFKNKVFHLGDIAFIQDTDFFGYIYVNGIKTPYKEKVLISEVTSHFDQPELDTFKVQNYKTQFEDLFQRITATTQSLQYATGEYARAASVVEPDGTINPQTLQNSFALNEQLVYSAQNESVITDSTGITVSDTTDPNKKTKVTSGGIFISRDGGESWKSAIHSQGVATECLTSGAINTNEITIMDGSFTSFRWDSEGINAFYKLNGNAGINLSKFVRFDHFGIYGIDLAGHEDEPYKPNSESDIWRDAKFGMTWDGFFIKNKYGTHQVEISSTEDIRVMKTPQVGNAIEVIKIGRIYHDPADSSNDLYGIRIRDGANNPVMETDNNGRLWLKNRLNISSTLGEYNIGIGYLDIPSGSTETLHRVIDANNKFIVYEDGSMKATQGEFTGTIYATGGRIGNVTINEVEQAAYRVVIESDAGTVFKNAQGTKHLTAKLYKGDDEILTGTFVYAWFLNGTQLSATTKVIEVSAGSLNEVCTYSCNITYTEPQS